MVNLFVFFQLKTENWNLWGVTLFQNFLNFNTVFAFRSNSNLVLYCIKFPKPNHNETKTYFCGSFGSFFFFFFEAFGLRAGGALGFIVLLLRFGESFPMYGSGDGRLKVLLACKWSKKVYVNMKFVNKA